MDLIPLSKETLQQAIDLTLKCFPESQPGDFDYPEKWLKYSLDQKNKRLGVGYWIMQDKKKVIAITGLYFLPHEEKEANWLGWTCIDHEHRGKKLGSKLLDSMIQKTKQAKKQYLRLYTTSTNDQKIARLLYEKRGFKETKREKDEKHECDIIYLQLKI